MELKAIDILSISIPAIDTKYSRKEIKAVIEKNDFSYFPVIENNKYLGLKSRQALMSDYISVNDLFFDLSSSDIFIYFDSQIYDIIDTFVSNNCTLLPVLDENDNYLGCISSDSLLGALANTITYKIPGSILTLEVSVNDYSMSEISGIIEAEKTSIVGLIINTAEPEAKTIDIVLKLNDKNIDRVLASFERFNYTVKSYHSVESNNHDKLRDHYEALMHYLNV